MSKFVCSVDNYSSLDLSVDEDNDIEISIYDDHNHQVVYLDKLSAQKLANELNQLLMEGKGNE